MEKLHEVLSGVKCAAVSGHVNPDGDCVGSCLLYTSPSPRD